MNVLGIVAECNPLHRGHQYLLKKAKEKADIVVVLLSGSFSQRGEPMCQDKFTRAADIIRAGGDLVLTFPVPFATSPAHEFAKGAMTLLASLPGISQICCGTEDHDPKLFNHATRLLQSQDLKKSLKSHLKKGLSYSVSLRLALEEKDPMMEELFQPNLLLALEYFLALSKIHRENLLMTIPRISSVGEKKILSASAIREEIQKGNFPLIKDYTLTDGPFTDLVNAKDLLFRIYRNRSLSGYPGLEDYFGYEKGIENFLLSNCKQTASEKNFKENFSTKRYSFPRISRLLLQYELGITKKIVLEKATYAPVYQVLAFNAQGRSYLKQYGSFSDAFFLTKYAKIHSLSKTDRLALSYEEKASDLYSILTDTEMGRDFRRSPYILE